MFKGLFIKQVGSLLTSLLLLSIIAAPAAFALDNGAQTPDSQDAPGARAGVPVAAGVQPAASLAPGAEVILKSTEAPLSEAGLRITTQDHLVFTIEKTEPDRMLLVSRDKTIHGWTHPENVVPLDRAVSFFGDVIASDRRNADAHWRRARLLLYLNQDRRALAGLTQAIRLKPFDARFYLTRSLVYFRTDQIDQAMQDCDKAIELDPASPRGYQLRANAWLRKKDQERASADLRRAMELDPTDPVSTHETTHRASDAEHFDDDDLDDKPAAGEEPKTAQAYVARGDEWRARQRFDRAQSDYSAAIGLDPRYAPAFLGRAQTWAHSYRRDKEIADYTEAIRLQPANPMYWLARAESWSAQGQHDRAMEDYDAALRLAPNTPALWVARGNEWRSDLKLDQAIADFTQAVRLDPKYIPAYVARATTWRQRRAFDKAIQEFSGLIRIDPQSALAYQSLARILATCTEAKFRNGKGAVDLAMRACELTHWRDPDCLDTLATAYAEIGDFPAAIKWENEGIKLVNQNVPSQLKNRSNSFGGRKGLDFQDRLAFYKSRKAIRE